MPNLSYCDVFHHLTKLKPVALTSLLTKKGLEKSKPGGVGVSKTKFQNIFGHQTNFPQNAGLYVFWWKGSADTLPSVTEHWVKGKQLGKDDPDENELGERAIYWANKPDDETSDEKAYKKFLHYRGSWQFHPIAIEDELYVPLYVGKSTHVFKRIKQHLSWSDTFVNNYNRRAIAGKKSELEKTAHKGIHIIPRYNTASQLSDHFHFLFRDKDDMGQQLKKENLCVSIQFTEFTDYESRFFFEDRLIGELRPPFNLDSER